MNSSQKAPVEMNSTNPFEDSLSMDESSSNPDQSNVGRLTKVSAVKPRPHAVKPLNATDKQTETQDACRSGQITGDTQVKMKVPEVKGTGPYSQLTNDELIKLLEKQKEQLSLKDCKIVELEQYIDNLLVRVMEENPSILMSLCLKKSA